MSIHSATGVVKFDHTPEGVIASKIITEKKCFPLVLREISILRRLKHDNIITFHSAKKVKNSYHICTKDGGITLTQYLHYHYLQNHEIRFYLRQLLSAISYAHSQGIYHRDLKSENIVVKEGKLRVIDFGLSRNVVEGVNVTPTYGTYSSTAPEVLMSRQEFSPKADEWSIGCILYHMMMGRRISTNTTEIEALMKWFNIFGTPTEDTWPNVSKMLGYKDSFHSYKGDGLSSILRTSDKELYNVCEGLLQMNPDKRLSCEDALRMLDMEMIPGIPYTVTHDYKLMPGSSITPGREAILMEWSEELRVYFRLPDNILKNAIILIKKYTSLLIIDKSRYQLLGMACLYLSEILHSIHNNTMESYVYTCDGAYTVAELEECIQEILELNEYDVDMLTL